MTRQDCYKILRLEPSAGPSAIKQAYRKLAFELHPDLNPGVPEASKRFQELNEAYVLLMQEYANTSYGARAKSADHSGAAGHADAKARAEAHRAYEKAKSRFTAAGGPGSTGAGGAAPGSPGATGPAGPAARGPRVGNRKPSREEILRDLLSDPFARRVFEDIYSHVRHGKGQSASAAKKPTSRSRGAPRPPTKKKALVKPAGTPMLIAAGGMVAELAGNMASGLRSWFRKQIDDEQIMYLPGESLYPGARVRLQVRHGFSENSRTIEFTLPPEFKPGRPIRLKGLGKHLGSFKGDLYLRVYSREELEEGSEE